MPSFFIDRPVFAWVIALVIMIAGALSLPGLPVAQFPRLSPPRVEIDTIYPGATAETVDASAKDLAAKALAKKAAVPAKPSAKPKPARPAARPADR